MSGILNKQQALTSFLQRVERSGGLTGRSRAALLDIAGAPRRLGRGECLVREGDSTGALSILAEGYAVGGRKVGDGQQQNLALFLSGDLLNVEEAALGDCDASVCALTSVVVVSVPLPALQTAVERHPELMRLLWRETAWRTRLDHEWMVGLGRRSALQRLAHLLCEIYTRLAALDAVRGHTCPLPLTQSDLADTLGLSPVHVNRVLQQLRGDGLIDLTHHRLLIRDWNALARLSEFDPKYLGLTQGATTAPCRTSTSISGAPTDSSGTIWV